MGLYADNSTTPGALTTVLGSVSDSVLSSTPEIYDVTLTANPLLTAATRYWIGLSGTTTAGWSWSLDISGTGVGSEYFSNPNGTFPNVGGPYHLDPAYSGVVWTRLTPCLSNCGVTFGRLSLTSLLVR